MKSKWDTTELNAELKRLAFTAVEVELGRAYKKFSSFNSPHEAYGVIKEEFDEMWDAIKKNDLGHAKLEAVQVAAMAIMFILDADNGFVK